MVIAAALLLVVSVLAFAAIGADEPGKIKLGEFIPAETPQPAPAFSFTDMAGKEAGLADFKGGVVLLNLWATWCQPCLKEMPSLAALQERLGSSLTVLALSEDRGGAETVKPFVEQHGLDKLKVYLDPKSTAITAFEARGLPSSFLIDADGKVLGKVEGAADWDSDKMRDALAKLLPPPKPS
ncbi:MAG TPA: TlpA disulfide reductase family protein [Stellaceae bacterium]|nr:TlpA disulfide reductase family protein [Stellaceae bacterium]